MGIAVSESRHIWSSNLESWEPGIRMWGRDTSFQINDQILKGLQIANFGYTSGTWKDNDIIIAFLSSIDICLVTNSYDIARGDELPTINSYFSDINPEDAFSEIKKAHLIIKIHSL